MHFSKRFAAIAALILASSTVPALAQGSIGGGVYTSSGNGTTSSGAGVLLSSGVGVPLVPFSVGVTAFAPIAKGGGYAATVDGTFAAGKNAVGVGYGFGQFGSARAGGTATLFFDHQLAPFTTLELRGYQTTKSGGGTAGFLGLKFSM
ncbi:MAG TPA: hypothetical protein VFN49_09160 [Candidatus Aquilonibacter sp.]|nr:hypothetical protein [Candidatus Aquilonibacter sp.]